MAYIRTHGWDEYCLAQKKGLIWMNIINTKIIYLNPSGFN
jgi:hypothetical protein